MLGYYIVKFVSWVVCRLPQCMQRGLAKLLGSLAVRFCPEWRFDMAKANISECLGIDEASAKRIAKDSLQRFGRMMVEVLCFPRLTKDKLLADVNLEGQEYLDQVLQSCKGAVLVTGHYGNWEVLGAFLAMYGCPMVSIVRHQNQGSMNRLINEYREMVGQKIAYNRGENNFLRIVRLLKQKHFIGVLYDQDTNDIGVKLEIFGKSCIVPDGAAALGRLDNAPILPMFIHNDAWGKFRLKAYPPLYCQGKEDYPRIMQTLVDILEQEIREDPSMWFWVHDRWKDGRQRFDKHYEEYCRRKHKHHRHHWWGGK